MLWGREREKDRGGMGEHLGNRGAANKRQGRSGRVDPSARATSLPLEEKVFRQPEGQPGIVLPPSEPTRLTGAPRNGLRDEGLRLKALQRRSALPR